jgi:MoaA/NifB/PqqE/SkfB family radical SAM enzyme
VADPCRSIVPIQATRHKGRATQLRRKEPINLSKPIRSGDEMKHTNLYKLTEKTLELYAYSKAPSSRIEIFPDHVHIEPTNACNLRCVHCHQSSVGTHFTKKRGLMDWDLYCRVIDQVAELSQRITLDNHGEPTNHPRIADMVSYAKSKGLSVSMLNNGTQMTEELAERLLDAEIDRVVFSFEGSSQELHEKVRRRSNFNKTMRNILYFLKRNCEKGGKTFVCMSMVKTSYTESDVENYQNYFGALPVDAVFINPLLNLSGGSPLGHEVDQDRISPDPTKRLRVCRMPWVDMAINWDGTISACIIDYNESHVLGDANVQSLTEIWNGPGYRKFRDCHLSGDFTWIEDQGPLCASCSLIYDPAYQEYDMLDMKEFATNYILRQSEVLAGKPSGAVKWTLTGDQYVHCVSELEKFDFTIKHVDKRKASDLAPKLNARNFRITAIENAPSKAAQDKDL